MYFSYQLLLKPIKEQIHALGGQEILSVNPVIGKFSKQYVFKTRTGEQSIITTLNECVLAKIELDRSTHHLYFNQDDNEYTLREVKLTPKNSTSDKIILITTLGQTYDEMVNKLESIFNGVVFEIPDPEEFLNK